MPDAPARSRERELWAVELGVAGRAWRHYWRGYALDSIDATDQARASLFGNARADTGARPFTVLSCLQVRT